MHTLLRTLRFYDLNTRGRTTAPDQATRTPRVLAPGEFHSMLPLIPEPFRTMILIAGCLGLRVSKIVARQWRDSISVGRRY